MKKKTFIILLMICSLCGCAAKEKETTNMSPTEEEMTQETKQELPYVEESSQAQNLLDEMNEKSNADAMLLYERFLGIQESDTEVKVCLDDEFMNSDYGLESPYKAGDELSFADLKAYIQNTYLAYSDKSIDDVDISYAYIDCEMDGENELAVCFNNLDIYSPGDDSTSTYIIKERDKKLYLTYTYDCWARSFTNMNQYGYVTGGGSGGAGDYLYDAGVLDRDGRYQPIYKAEELMGWWVSYLDNDIYQSVYGADNEPDMCVTKYQIGDQEICTYNAQEEEKEMDRTFIERCTEKGIVWKTQEEIDNIVEEQENALGVTQEVKSDEPCDWKTLPD